MTVRRGQPWGEPGPLPSDAPTVTSDREMAEVFSVARRLETSLPPVGLLGGDLARTCGATGDLQRLRGPDAQQLPVDLGEAVVDGRTVTFAAHLVVRRRSWWWGTIVAVMNAQFHGDWDVAPRGHPNDGRLDILVADLGPGDRWKARARLATGTHVPHPAITESRVQHTSIDLEPGARVWVDGVPIGPARQVEVRCIPDALTVVV